MVFYIFHKRGKIPLELAVMGVRKEYHRMGIGKKLFERARYIAQKEGFSFIQVKTVKWEYMRTMIKQTCFIYHSDLRNWKFSQNYGMKQIPVKYTL